jgi:hypothetical protein
MSARSTHLERKRLLIRSREPWLRPLLHTRSQAARMLSVSVSTLRRLEQEGVLTPIKLNKSPSGMVLYRHRELFALAGGRR